MKKIRVYSMAVLIVLITAGYFFVSGQKAADRTELVALGDSLTYGVGDKTGAGYVDDLHKLLNEHQKQPVIVYNFGIPGQQTDGLLQQLLQPGVQQRIQDADNIIIYIGTNDLIESNGGDLFPLYQNRISRGKADYENNLKKIFRIIRQNNPEAPILFLGLYNPYPSSGKVERVVDKWNHDSRKIVSGYQETKFIETNGLFDKKSAKYFSDALHPTKYGYRRITKKIVEEFDF